MYMTALCTLFVLVAESSLTPLPPPCSVAGQAPLSMAFPGTNTGVGSFLLQGIFPTQGLNWASPVSPSLAGGFFTTWEVHGMYMRIYNTCTSISNRIYIPVDVSVYICVCVYICQ